MSLAPRVFALALLRSFLPLLLPAALAQAKKAKNLQDEIDEMMKQQDAYIPDPESVRQAEARKASPKQMAEIQAAIDRETESLGRDTADMIEQAAAAAWRVIDSVKCLKKGSQPLSEVEKEVEQLRGVRDNVQTAMESAAMGSDHNLGPAQDMLVLARQKLEKCKLKIKDAEAEQDAYSARLAEEQGEEEQVCDAGADGSCPVRLESSPMRQVLEKTPTPCQESYSKEHIQEAASAHLGNINGGHQVPHLLVLFGGSAAGKGTFIKHMRKHGMKTKDWVFHGLDEYLVYLPEFKNSVNDPKNVYKDAADACYGGGAIPIAKAAQEKIIAGRLHTIYEETGKNLERVLKRVLPPFEEAGYRITLVLVDNHVGIAQGRAEARFYKEGRFAAADYIVGSYKKVPENYKELRNMGRVHEAVYCDNSCMGDGTKLEDAVIMKGCLKCWRDVSIPPAGNAGVGPLKFFIPEEALASGAPRYLNAAAR